MIKKYLFLASVLSAGFVTAQVGINNTNPKSTFHVIASKTDGTTAEGIIAPNLTRAQLIAKDGQYGVDQRGAIVYVTTIDGTATTKTGNVTLSGYYYFTGTVWEAFRSATAVIPTEPWQVQGSTAAATSNAENIYQTGSVAVGSNSAGSYKFQVTGTSNVTGNSRVASSTVVGNETVGGTLGVTGGASLASTLAVTGTSTLTGNVGIGAASNASYKLQVTGASNVTGNSRVASSTVVGNETVGGTLGVTGAATLSNNLTVGGISALKATNMTGVLNYQPSGTAPTANTYLRTDATGNASWQSLPVTATTEPWQVQGGTTAATTNAQSIYQTGSVHIGANTAVTAYKFQVTGASNVTGNSRVGSSTVAGNETVAGTLGVTGAASLASTLAVTGTSTLTGNVGIGAASNASYKLQVTGASNVTGNSRVASSTVVGNETVGGTLGVTGTSTLTGNVGIGAASNASYKLQVTGASNITGNSRVASSTVVGNETVGGTLAVGSATSLPAGALFGVQTVAPNAGIANSTKGFMYPRLTLSSLVSLAPMIAGGGSAAEKLQHVGLAVYHLGGNTLPEGLYSWNGTQWLRLLTEIPLVTSVIADLKTTIYAPHLSWNQPQLGATLDFGQLEVKEDGSYALMLRLYGLVYENTSDKNLTSAVASSIYIWVFRSGISTAADAAELAYTMLPYGTGAGQGSPAAAFTAALTVPDAKKGEILTIKIGTNQEFSRFNFKIRAGDVPAAARTSLFYWKL